ncbi:retinol dehydrogenase 12-like [Lytechinus pictus]|uniref:retinol dehydrogenase 12-like n=1 Tax=Lytechinus pictus TaxID=7653 RepID=UPI00240E7042|nr:retinol dehydrogenase 12-like [Lytechinus pictus]
MAMEIAKDLLEHGKVILRDSADWFHAASLPVQVAVGTVGFLAASYGLYCVWFYGGTRRVKSSVTLKGKTVIITGGNSGIGRETAVDLASRGARVILGCRNPTKAEAAVAEVRRRSNNQNVIFKLVDVSDLESVRNFAEEILREEKRLDILINNAGIGGTKYRTTPEGFDIVMATNHVGHFVLTLTLIDLIKKSAPSRIINVSSLLHSSISNIDYTNKSGKGVKKMEFYGRSKLANVHFARELARRLEGTGVTSYSLHPGAIYSNIWETSWGSSGTKFLYYLFLPILTFCMLSEKDGAQTTIYCAIDESITHLSGGYFSNCRKAKESKLAKDDKLAKQLWDVSCEATGISPDILKA